MKLYRVMILILAGIGFSIVAFSQTAQVVPLDPDDATYIKHLYDQKAELEAKISRVQELVEQKYLDEILPAPKGPNHESSTMVSLRNFASNLKTSKLQDVSKPAAKEGDYYWSDSHWMRIPDGWDYGFEYTKDFKYIVPKPRPVFTEPITHTPYYQFNGFEGSSPIIGLGTSVVLN